ncbi:hypothetical protein Plim_0212 [Planctopirus limnophila DSM 3776]|uniref:Uncharacterized protein n=1 Tax=Planctopirus limnophila (strain ATCC 43296 / DSM 3776 / IFAM 1008 / Mu 290) TaxID=521674 RepID=D5SND7_PLAL2|nr:hypothetical protein Plim_0212 [Planctopirus limnophila DSM 3776]
MANFRRIQNCCADFSTASRQQPQIGKRPADDWRHLTSDWLADLWRKLFPQMIPIPIRTKENPVPTRRPDGVARSGSVVWP